MAFRLTEDGVELFVRLTPRSDSDRIDGVVEGADNRIYLAVRVRAVPEKGRANSVLEKLIAKAVGLVQRDVSVASGATSRLKMLRLSGDPDILSQRLKELAADPIGGAGKRR